MARQVFDAPLRLLSRDALKSSLAAPSAELRELLVASMHKAFEYPLEDERIDVRVLGLGAPGQAIPVEYVAGLRELHGWVELRERLTQLPAQVPLQWRADAELFVYVMMSELNAARLRRFVERMRRRMSSEQHSIR